MEMERQQDLKKIASSSYFKDLKRKYMEFYIIELLVGNFFVNTVLGLLLGEGLGPESVHRIEIHTLFPTNNGNRGAAPQHFCKSKHLQQPQLI